MKTIMLFPGYGSQNVGMAKELYDESRLLQEYFEEASNCLSINFVRLCFASSSAELGKMPNAYTATFLVSASLFSLLKQEGITPDAVAGYNFGEYAALYAAQSLSFPDGLYLLTKFATFYQEMATKTEFAALHIKGLPADEVQRLCTEATTQERAVHIALHNTHDEHVIGGHAAAIYGIRDQLRDAPKIHVEEVNIEVGMHSPLMDPVLQQLSMYLEKVDFKDPVIPMISCVDAKTITSHMEIKDRILCHLHNPISWQNVMDSLVDYDLIIEVGPGAMLSTMVKTKYPDKITVSVNGRDDIDELKKILGIQQPITMSETIQGGESNGTI